MIRFDQTICSDFEAAANREWLETNGIGGFASSTLSGMNRRRYHALLVAATQPPAGRVVLLSKLEETLVLSDGRRIDLSTNQYLGAVHPQGYQWITAFRLDPFPIWNFTVEGIEIEKTLFMVDGENTTVAQYRLLRGPAGQEMRLEVRPLVAFRDYHSLTHANGAACGDVHLGPDLASVCLYGGMPALHLAHNADHVDTAGNWYYNFEYEAERERGLDDCEDLFNPLTFSFALSTSTPATIIASTEVRALDAAGELREQELRRRAQITSAARTDDEFGKVLASAADQFLVRRGSDWTVLAGYPWFTDWGRDTMIALPGLTLSTGRSDLCSSVLRNFAKFVDQGMLPNRFPDSGEQPEYNTVDATLWYFEAIRRYVQVSSDLDFAREIYPTLTGIIDWHVKGTRYGIRVLENGLLHAGEPGVQLTWMDAKIGDWVVTPRKGCPVEIQALWHNALKIAADLARWFAHKDEAERYEDAAALLQSNFEALFWNEAERCLVDVVDGDARDAAIRPNQVFAVSLHHPLVTGNRARAVLDVVERELLTPYGLRTLSPRDSNYRGRFDGDMRSRDSAYHQGTVWPWLLGHFISGYLRIHGRDAAARGKVAAWLEPFHAYATNLGVGQIAEVFDGDAPHRPGGCFAQAWSVAEVLRVLTEDLGKAASDA
ncbi:MAG TPA: amylo-alpha-1,6-glucosidase [Terriglobales bacterium]|nr:amylo-alpha-1,6-glucosidase [Terriglobales bacterium]